MNIVETIVKHIEESTSFRPRQSVITILPWELEQVLKFYLMPRSCSWCDHTHVLSRPCEKCDCFGPLNRGHAEPFPPCRCGSPSMTIIGEVPLCAPCAGKWQDAAAKWPSPVEPGPSSPTPDERPCVQTRNRFGYPMGDICSENMMPGKHSDCPYPPVTDQVMRICRHHDYLPAPQPPEPRIRSGNAIGARRCLCCASGTTTASTVV